MKRTNLISFALATALTASSALAQPATGRHSDPETHLQRLSVILELSAQQQSQLRDMLEARRENRDGRRQADIEARAQRREARRADHEAFEQQIAAMLSDTQKAKFEALIAERQAQRPRRQGPQAGGQGEG
jgi:Spy/CpxP family protein refolding chaperone